MEVVADLVQGMLRHLALEIPKLVDAAALNRSPRPHQPDSAPQPGIAIDDDQHRRPQSSRDEIFEAAFPGRERLPAAQVQGKQVLVPVGQDADDAEDRYAHHFSRTAHGKRETIEVDVDHVEVGE